MAYSRQPNVTIAGRGLTQSPAQNPKFPGGILQVGYDSNIATTNELGVVQVGEGLNITFDGILSTTNSSGAISVKLVENNYIATHSDYYIGAILPGITITLPLGIIGKLYIIKNQATGVLNINTTMLQKIDNATSKNIGFNDTLIVIFDGNKWQII